MALYDKYGRFVILDAAKLIAEAGAVVDDVVRIKNDTTSLFNVLWMQNNQDGIPETSQQELAKYEDGAVKLYNISDGDWYNVGCLHNVDNKPTLYYSNSGLPINNSRFTYGYWEIKSDSTPLWYKVGTQLNQDGKKELYVATVGNP